MTNLINTISTALSNTVLFAAGVIMAGLGLAFVGAFALFALMAVGVAIIAAPFVGRAQPVPADAEIAA